VFFGPDQEEAAGDPVVKIPEIPGEPGNRLLLRTTRGKSRPGSPCDPFKSKNAEAFWRRTPSYSCLISYERGQVGFFKSHCFIHEG
jgi:hypothetical protein